MSFVTLSTSAKSMAKRWTHVWKWPKSFSLQTISNNTNINKNSSHLFGRLVLPFFINDFFLPKWFWHFLPNGSDACNESAGDGNQQKKRVLSHVKVPMWMLYYICCLFVRVTRTIIVSSNALAKSLSAIYQHCTQGILLSDKKCVRLHNFPISRSALTLFRHLTWYVFCSCSFRINAIQL